MRRYYVSYPSLHPKPLTIAAQLRVPAVAHEVPAVVIVHGSSGVDSRGSFHAEALNQAGIASLEIDMWSPRHLKGGLDRPKNAIETLPDVYGAFKFLASRPEIDPSRIGIMGFSWGGVLSMLTATLPYTRQYLGDRHFAAHAPFYPVCWRYNQVPGWEFREFTGAPVLIQAGAADTYDDPDTCTQLVASLSPEARKWIKAKVYPGATHAWDRLAEGPITVFDPNAAKGQGAQVDFIPNPKVASASRRTTVKFFQQAFAL